MRKQEEEVVDPDFSPSQGIDNEFSSTVNSDVEEDEEERENKKYKRFGPKKYLSTSLLEYMRHERAKLQSQHNIPGRHFWCGSIQQNKQEAGGRGKGWDDK